MNVISKPITSSNYSKGRFDIEKNPVRPDVVVVHVGEGSMEKIFNTFNNPIEQKSAHYLISKKGEVWYLVDEDDTAWTQGFVKNSTSKLIKERIGKYPNPNSYCISIENEGYGEDFTEEQYKANGTLIADICYRWDIPLHFPDIRDHVIGHNEIRSDKTCPGKVSMERIIRIAQGKESPVEKCEVIVQEQKNVIAKLIALIRDYLKG